MASMDICSFLVLFGLSSLFVQISACVCYPGQRPNPRNNGNLDWFLPVDNPCDCTLLLPGGVNVITRPPPIGVPPPLPAEVVISRFGQQDLLRDAPLCDRPPTETESTSPGRRTSPHQSWPDPQIYDSPGSQSYHLFEDCQDLKLARDPTNGIYTITPLTFAGPVDAFCDMESDDHGWIVIQRRHGMIDFTRGWLDYKNGFGDLDGNFWWGNERLRLLTSVGSVPWMVRIDLVLNEQTSFTKIYDVFRVNGSHYNLTCYNHQVEQSYDVLFDGTSFSTAIDGGRCAQTLGGGWWFKEPDDMDLITDCFELNPALLNSQIMKWQGEQYVISKSEMKIRRGEPPISS